MSEKILLGNVSQVFHHLELLRILVILVLKVRMGGSRIYFLDPMTGIATVFSVQLAPTRDSEVSKVAIKLERTLYEALKIILINF